MQRLRRILRRLARQPLALQTGQRAYLGGERHRVHPVVRIFTSQGPALIVPRQHVVSLYELPVKMQLAAFVCHVSRWAEQDDGEATLSALTNLSP